MKVTEFGNYFESAIEKYIDHMQAEKTVEWEARNDGEIISGSGFSQCTRLAYYRQNEDRQSPRDPSGYYPLDNKKKMFLGYHFEDMVHQILLNLTKDMPNVSIHENQLSPPVNIRLYHEGYPLGSTTDFVIKWDDIYIPIELKSSDRESGHWDPSKIDKKTGRVKVNPKTGTTGGFVSSTEWWDNLERYPDHERQLCWWMYIAQQTGMKVPYGLLYYIRRTNMATKGYLYHVDRDVGTDSLPENFKLHDYSMVEPALLARRDELVHALKTKTTPPYDSTIPAYRCNYCIFKTRCEGER